MARRAPNVSLGVEVIKEGGARHTKLSKFIDLWKAREIESLGDLAPVTSDEVTARSTPPPEPSIDEADIGGGTSSQ